MIWAIKFEEAGHVFYAASLPDGYGLSSDPDQAERFNTEEGARRVLNFAFGPHMREIADVVEFDT